MVREVVPRTVDAAGRNCDRRSIDTLGSGNRLVAAEFYATEATFEVGEGTRSVQALVVHVSRGVCFEIDLRAVTEASIRLAINLNGNGVVVAETGATGVIVFIVRSPTSLEVRKTTKGYFRGFSRSRSCKQCRAYEPSCTKKNFFHDLGSFIDETTFVTLTHC